MTTSLPPRPTTRRQIRVFVIVWMALTLLMGACVFVAIYLLSGETNLSRSIAANKTATPTYTLVPTMTPVEATATMMPTLELTTAPEQQAPAPEPPTPTLLPREDKRFGYGIQVQENYDLQGYWMDMVAGTLGMTWIKQQIRWESMEPERGEIDFSVLDLVVPAANERGLKLMLSVVTAPDWARPTGADLSQHGPPADFQDYANFLTAILERYPGQVHAIEVWNEQNLDREWSDPQGLSAARYVELLGIAERAIHAIDPGVIVISGALSPTGVTDATATDDFRYFDQLLEAGLLNYADCVGAHHNGYNIPPDALSEVGKEDTLGPKAQYFTGPWDNPHHSWSFRATLDYYYTRIVADGGAQKLCITEFGWATVEDLDGYPVGFEFARDNTLQEQADWTVQAFNWLAGKDEEAWDGAWIAFLWNLNYGAQAGGDPTNDNVPYGILDGDGLPRPAFDAIANMPKD